MRLSSLIMRVCKTPLRLTPLANCDIILTDARYMSHRYRRYTTFDKQVAHIFDAALSRSLRID